MDIARFDLNLLRSLDVLLEERNVSSAAARAGLSQPAMSAALNRMRSALDDRLLVRRGNRMELTSFADGLRPRLRGLLAELQRMLAPEAFEPSHSERRFRIAATDFAATVVLLPLMRRLRETAPGVAFDLLALDDRIESDLAAGLCDLVVGGAGWLSKTDLRETVLVEPYVSVARRDHPRLSGQVALDDFLAERHVLISLHRQAKGVVDDALGSIGRERSIGLTVASFLVAIEAVADTDMILTTGYHLARIFADRLKLRLFETPVQISAYELPMAAHRRSEHDPAVSWIRREIRAFARSLEDRGGATTKTAGTRPAADD